MTKAPPKPVPPWRLPGPADAYLPSRSGPRSLRLSPRATREIFDQIDPTDEEAYLLVGMDGMLKADGHLYRSIDNATAAAMQENMVIVHLREPGHVFRIVWPDDQLPRRTEDNFELEEVLLEPDVAALDDERLANTKKLKSIFKGMISG